MLKYSKTDGYMTILIDNLKINTLSYYKISTGPYKNITKN